MNIKMKNKYFISIVSLVIIISTIIINCYGFFQVTFYPIVKHIEKTRILKNVVDYEILETEHFIIRYKREDEKYAKLTGSIGEEYYDEICSMYEYYPSEKSNIILYSSEVDFVENLKLDKNSLPTGVYYSGTINILSPKIWIEDFNKLEEIYEFNGPVLHEFSHLLIDDITNGNYPMWLTEGLALYTEYKTTGFEWPNNNKVNEITIEDLDKRFDKLDQIMAYRKSFDIVREISEDWGFDKIKSMLNILGTGKNMKRSVKAVLKINLYEL